MALITTADLQIWAAGTGGGNGIARASGDPTQSGGITAYDIAQLYQNAVDNLLTTSVAEGFFRITDIAIDTVHGKYFIADSNGAGQNRVLQGNLADLLSGAPPSLTILYRDAGSGTATRIDNLEIDPNSGIVYFTHGQRFEKVSYDTALQTPTILANFATGNPNGTTNNFIDDFVIDFATGSVYLSSHRVIAGSEGDSVTKNYVYKISGLTPASPAGAFTFANGGITVLPFNPDDNDSMPNGTAANGEAFPQEGGSLEGLAVSPDGSTLYFATATTLFDHDGDGGAVTAPVVQYGGIYSYALSGNAAGTFSVIYQQTAGSGPQGQLDDLEIDFVTGHWYAADITGASSSAGDEGIWRGSLSGGTPTFFASVSNAGGLIPGGFILNRAPTIAVTDGGAAAVETAGPGSGSSTAALPLSSVTVSDFETADQVHQLAGARVRIADYGVVGGHAEQLTIAGAASGTLASGISYSFNATTGVMTLTGAATFAQYQAALQLVAYSISGDNPSGYGAYPTREIAYSVSDGLISSDEQSVTVDVAATNDAPVNSVGGPVSAVEASPAAITGLAVSDVDADPANDVISVTLSATIGNITVSDSVGGGVTAGQISGNGTGSVTITATQNAINATFAAAGGVTYTGTDGGSDLLTMTTNDLGQTGAGGAQQDVDAIVITVTGLNEDPEAPPTNSASTAEDTASAATPIGASDADGDTLTYSEKPGFGAANGTVTFDQTNGTFTYTPDSNFNGSDSFTILISDGQGGTAEQAVSVTVTPVNDAPAASATNSVTTAEDSASAPTAIGASDVDGDTLTYSEKPGSGPANGSVAFNQGAGTFTYTPTANFNGSDSFTIVVSDGNGGTAEQVVSVTVTPVNDAPTAPATNSASTAEDTASAATAINASDLDGDSLSYSEKAGAGAANGTVTFNQAAGTFTYTPNSNFNGSDSFTILISDGQGGTAEQAVSVTVTPVNDAPAASATNSVTTAEDNASAPTAIGASDVDGDTLTYSEKAGSGPANGTVAFNQGAGTFTYTPTANFNGSDSFTIVVSDGNGGTAEQVVSVTVTPVNDAPTAPATNSVSTSEDTASAATAIGASDVDGDSLSYSEKLGAGAANGTVTFNNANGTFTYTPDPDFNGSDSFTIVISDGQGGTAEQGVSVTVDEVNDAPTGVTGNLSAPEDAVNGSSAGTVVAQDPDSSSFTYVLVDDAGGRFDMDANGNVTVADGLLLDYEQASSHVIRVGVTDDMGAYAEFDKTVTVQDVLGEDVTGDARDNVFHGGAENDTLRGMDGNDTLVGGGGQDTLEGGNGADTIEGGAGDDNISGGAGNDRLSGGLGSDYLIGGTGNDVFVLRKGEANGDTISGFWGQGASDGDSIVLEGYGAGTTFTRVGGGSSTLFKIDDNGFVEYVNIVATGQVHSTDYTYAEAQPTILFMPEAIG